MQLATGFVLDQRYLVERELGRGGVGVVYLARDEQLHSRPVVIKVLLEESYRDDWIKTKFRQEMEALSRLDHPGIVNLLNTGELQDGRPYLVMQYVDGILLRALIRPEGMDLDRTAPLIRQIGDALSAAHERGVLHRDLKPENIMIQSPGSGEQIKIIDFGLAKVMNSQIAKSTSIPNVAGSFSYMSPEQLMARPVSAASDVYSFAVIAYEMITGRRPHNPESLFQLLDMLRSGVRIKPRDLRPSVPHAVDPIILKALSYNAADRPASTSVFGDELASVLLNDPASPAAEETVHFSVVSAPEKRTARYFALWISLVVFTFAALLFSKNTFFRFQSWTFFLSQPQILIPAVVWLVGALGLQLIGFLRGSRSSLYDRIFRSYWFLPIAVFLVGSAALFFASMRGAPVLAGQVVGGNPQAQSCCSLKYSDPRGYRYTFQRDSYYRIRIAPGGHNRLQDYDIQVTLPSELEFADVYVDRAFPLSGSLQLQPSSTNDILKLHLAGDSFSGSREILFTTKYRTPPQSVRISVDLETSGESQAYAF